VDYYTKNTISNYNILKKIYKLLCTAYKVDILNNFRQRDKISLIQIIIKCINTRNIVFY